MTTETRAFARLLSPVTVEEFFAGYWQRQPLLVQREDRHYFADLLTLDGVDAILTQQDPRAGAVRLVKKGDPTVAADLFGPDGRLDLARVYARHAQGATIVLNDVQRRSAALAGLCRDVELRLQCPAGINVYLTPKHAQGVDAHFDIHDVFILQAAGSKRWRVYGAPTPLPLADEPFPPERRNALGAPLYEAELRAGDLLYLPRGFVHEAETSAQLSLHLTIGVHCYRWLEVLTEALVVLARKKVGLREALPGGSLDDGPERDEARERFRQLLHELIEEASFDDALARIEGRFLASLPALPDGHLARVEALDTVTVDTPVCHRPGLRCRVFREGDHAILQFPGGQVQGPAALEPAFQFVARTRRFTGRQLPGAAAAPQLPRPLGMGEVAPLSEKSRVALIRRLIESGLLAIAAPESGPTE